MEEMEILGSGRGDKREIQTGYGRQKEERLVDTHSIIIGSAAPGLRRCKWKVTHKHGKSNEVFDATVAF
jgi:hypothetical protein